MFEKKLKEKKINKKLKKLIETPVIELIIQVSKENLFFNKANINWCKCLLSAFDISNFLIFFSYDRK